MDTGKNLEQRTYDEVVKKSTRPVLIGQSRKIIYNVYCFMKKEAEKQNGRIKIISRTAEATQVSFNTVRRIIQESKISDDFKTPGTVRRSVKPITGLSPSNLEMITQCIRNFQNTQSSGPTISKIMSKLPNFKGSESSLRRILKQLGFKWTQDKKWTKVKDTPAKTKAAKTKAAKIKAAKAKAAKPDPVYTDIKSVTIKKEVADVKVDSIDNGHNTNLIESIYLKVPITEETEVYPSNDHDYVTEYGTIKKEI